jgi:hypothetical protein
VEIQWFTTSKKVSDTEVSLQVDGICFLGQIWYTAFEYLKRGATITASYNTSLLVKMKQALVSKRLGKLQGGVLLHQDNASSHTAQAG